MILKQERDPQKFQQDLERQAADARARKRVPWMLAVAFAGAFCAMIAAQQVAEARFIELEKVTDSGGVDRYTICVTIPIGDGCYMIICRALNPAPPPPPPPPPDPKSEVP
jgi:hypothetical protein